MGVIVVLVLTSGFVAGTTATLSGTTSNAGNEFASAALSPPTGLSATPSGDNVNVAWTDASGYDNVNAGYRVSVADWQAAPQPVPTVCATGSSYTKVNTASSSSYSDTTTATNPPHPNTFVDGRLWCYKAETVYPFPENTNPWLSQTGNPTTVVEMGNTLVGVTIVGDGDNNLEAADKIQFTFNQPLNSATWPTGYLCTLAGAGTAGRIFVGIDGSTTSAACPQTGGTVAQRDTTLRGFAFTGGGVTQTARFNLGTFSSIGCSGSAPPGCYRIELTIGSKIVGTTPVISGTWTVRGTSNTAFLDTSTGARNFCAASTTTTTINTPFVVRNDPTTPAAGKCQVTSVASAF